MCLPTGAAPGGALLQGPGSREAWSFDAAAPSFTGELGIGMGHLPFLLGSVSPTASERQSSHPEQPSHSAGWQQIIHVARVGLGKWKMPWRRSLDCVGEQTARLRPLSPGG